MKRPYLAPIACIACGLAVIAGSIVLQQSPSPESGWTPDKAAAYQQASEDLVKLSKQPGVAPDDPRRRAAEQRYDELREELNQARGGAVLVGMVLQMLGVGLGLIGAVWLILRQNQAEDAGRSA